MSVGSESSGVDRPTKPVLLRLIDINPPPEVAEPYVFEYSPMVARLPLLDPRPKQREPEPTEPPLRSRTPVQRPAMISAAEARAHATKLARGLLEVLAGRRQARQLSALLSPDLLAKVETLRCTGRRPAAGGHLTAVRVCQPSPDGIEVSAVFRCGARYQALAARLDLVDQRWICTDFQIG